MFTHSVRGVKCAREVGAAWRALVLVWVTNGKWAAQRVQCGRVKAKLGRKTKMRPLAVLVKAMRALMRCTSSGCVGLVIRSFFFLEEWELAKVALSCQEIHEALVAALPLLKGPLSEPKMPFSHHGRTVTKTERVVVRE